MVRNKKTGASFIIDDNPNSKNWKRIIAMVARAAMLRSRIKMIPEGAAVRAFFTYWLPRPHGHYRTGKFSNELKEDAPDYPTTKPDVLKLTRAAEDAMTGIVYHDDSMIVDEGPLRKRYTEKGLSPHAYASHPGVRIQIEVIPRKDRTKNDSEIQPNETCPGRRAGEGDQDLLNGLDQEEQHAPLDV